MIRKFFPQGFPASLRDDFELCVFLRDWIVRNIPVGNSPIDYDSPEGVIGKALAGEIGFFCGGSSLIMHWLCQSLGFQSACLHFGSPHDASINGHRTHVLVAVKMRDAGRAFLFDPYMGVEFLDEDGGQVEFGRLFAGLQENSSRHFRVAFPHITDSKPTIITSPAKYLYTMHDGKMAFNFPVFQKAVIELLSGELAEVTGCENSMLSYIRMPFYIGKGDRRLIEEIRELYSGYGFHL